MILKTVVGVIIGGALGFLYYKVVGCPNGTCPITSRPFNAILYGAVMGILISNI